MSADTHQNLVAFIIEAKKACYASGATSSGSSRPGSIDLPYKRGLWSYLDSYYGGVQFVGEETVWHMARPVWAMNYAGGLTGPEVDAAFSPFLKVALSHVPEDAPYRGPRRFVEGEYVFLCEWSGVLERFSGYETIERNGVRVYELHFHGGSIS